MKSRSFFTLFLLLGYVIGPLKAMKKTEQEEPGALEACEKCFRINRLEFEKLIRKTTCSTCKRTHKTQIEKDEDSLTVIDVCLSWWTKRGYSISPSAEDPLPSLLANALEQTNKKQKNDKEKLKTLQTELTECLHCPLFEWMLASKKPENKQMNTLMQNLLSIKI